MFIRTSKCLLHQQRRCFSAIIDASKTVVTMNTNLKKKQPVDKLEFGRTFTDHMLTIDWDKERYVQMCNYA
jgi:branched-chain amino acid aminotransferase